MCRLAAHMREQLGAHRCSARSEPATGSGGGRRFPKFRRSERQSSSEAAYPLAQMRHMPGRAPRPSPLCAEHSFYGDTALFRKYKTHGCGRHYPITHKSTYSCVNIRTVGSRCQLSCCDAANGGSDSKHESRRSAVSPPHLKKTPGKMAALPSCASFLEALHWARYLFAQPPVPRPHSPWRERRHACDVARDNTRRRRSGRGCPRLGGAGLMWR